MIDGCGKFSGWARMGGRGTRLRCEASERRESERCEDRREEAKTTGKRRVDDGGGH